MAAARKMAKITAHTTIANYLLRPRYHLATLLTNFERLLPTAHAVPVDEGFIDYTAFLDELAEGGFAGLISYEMCSPLRGGGSMENLDRYARRFVEFMKARERVKAA